MTDEGASAVVATAPQPAEEPMATTYEADLASIDRRLKRLYPNIDFERTHVPTRWSHTDKSALTSVSLLDLRFSYLDKGAAAGEQRVVKEEPGAVRSNHPAPLFAGVYYYEVHVLECNKGFMGLGFCQKSVKMNRLPGWDPLSYGYHGDDGAFFSASGSGTDYGPTFGTGDVIGCGINMVRKTVFFTKNGVNLGNAMHIMDGVDELYPTVGLQTSKAMIDANFGQKDFVYDIFKEIQGMKDELNTQIRAMRMPIIHKKTWLNQYVASWMAIEGHAQSLKTFCEESKTVYAEIDEKNVLERKELTKKVLTGQCTELYEELREKYKRLESERALSLDIRVQRYAEKMLRKARRDAMKKMRKVNQPLHANSKASGSRNGVAASNGKAAAPTKAGSSNGVAAQSKRGSAATNGSSAPAAAAARRSRKGKSVAAGRSSSAASTSSHRRFSSAPISSPSGGCARLLPVQQSARGLAVAARIRLRAQALSAEEESLKRRLKLSSIDFLRGSIRRPEKKNKLLVATAAQVSAHSCFNRHCQLMADRFPNVHSHIVAKKANAAAAAAAAAAAEAMQMDSEMPGPSGIGAAGGETDAAAAAAAGEASRSSGGGMKTSRPQKRRSSGAKVMEGETDRDASLSRPQSTDMGPPPRRRSARGERSAGVMGRGGLRHPRTEDLLPVDLLTKLIICDGPLEIVEQETPLPLEAAAAAPPSKNGAAAAAAAEPVPSSSTASASAASAASRRSHPLQLTLEECNNVVMVGKEMVDTASERKRSRSAMIEAMMKARGINEKMMKKMREWIGGKKGEKVDWEKIGQSSRELLEKVRRVMNGGRVMKKEDEKRCKAIDEETIKQFREKYEGIFERIRKRLKKEKKVTRLEARMILLRRLQGIVREKRKERKRKEKRRKEEGGEEEEIKKIEMMKGFTMRDYFVSEKRRIGGGKRERMMARRVIRRMIKGRKVKIDLMLTKKKKKKIGGKKKEENPKVEKEVKDVKKEETKKKKRRKKKNKKGKKIEEVEKMEEDTMEPKIVLREKKGHETVKKGEEKEKKEKMKKEEIGMKKKKKEGVNVAMKGLMKEIGEKKKEEMTIEMREKKGYETKKIEEKEIVVREKKGYETVKVDGKEIVLREKKGHETIMKMDGKEIVLREKKGHETKKMEKDEEMREEENGMKKKMELASVYRMKTVLPDGRKVVKILRLKKRTAPPVMRIENGRDEKEGGGEKNGVEMKNGSSSNGVSNGTPAASSLPLKDPRLLKKQRRLLNALLGEEDYDDDEDDIPEKKLTKQEIEDIRERAGYTKETERRAEAEYGLMIREGMAIWKEAKKMTEKSPSVYRYAQSAMEATFALSSSAEILERHAIFGMARKRSLIHTINAGLIRLQLRGTVVESKLARLEANVRKEKIQLMLRGDPTAAFVDIDRLMGRSGQALSIKRGATNFYDAEHVKKLEAKRKEEETEKLRKKENEMRERIMTIRAEKERKERRREEKRKKKEEEERKKKEEEEKKKGLKMKIILKQIPAHKKIDPPPSPVIDAPLDLSKSGGRDEGERMEKMDGLVQRRGERRPPSIETEIVIPRKERRGEMGEPGPSSTHHRYEQQQRAVRVQMQKQEERDGRRSQKGPAAAAATAATTAGRGEGRRSRGRSSAL